MHLAAPGAVAHLYRIHCALAQGGMDRTWISPAFYQKIADWHALTAQIEDRPMYLAEIVFREATCMGFLNALSLRARYMCIDTSKYGRCLVWCHPWPPDIITNLVLATNPERQLTNSNLNLIALILHEETILAEVPAACMAAPRSGLDNTPTILWSMC